MHHHNNKHHQLQPYGTGASTNSAHSSPIKRGPPSALSPLASPMESRRVFVPPTSAQSSVSSADHSMHNANAIQLGYTLTGPAQPAKLLIDPQTGQQYFVPATPQPMSYFTTPAPLFYPNQFYTTPAPTAVTAQSHSGFMLTNHPPNSLWSPHCQQLNSPNAPSHAPSHCQQRQRALSPSSAVSSAPAPCSTIGGINHHQNFAYHVEVPLSSVGSVCEEAELVQYQQQSFQRHNQIRQSTDSRGSVRSLDENSRQEGHIHQKESLTNDRFSPAIPSPSPSQNQPPPRHQLLQLQFDRHSTGGSSSESTSGFASGRDRLRAEEVSDGRSPPQSPLMRKEKTHFPPIHSEEATLFRSDSPKSPSLPKPLPQRMKAIRMDIDLKRPVSPNEHEQQVSVRTTVLRTAPPTAFTISFNDSPSLTTNVPSLSETSLNSAGGAREFSLQEAARNAPTGRRLMPTVRRNMPSHSVREKSERAGTDSGSEAGDPKRWLFRKMMMGRDGRTKETEEGKKSEEESGDDADDMVSETGTYVVESKKTCQSKPTTSTFNPRGGRSGNSAPPSTSSASNSSSSRTPSPILAEGETALASKRSLMSDLRRLREQKKNSAVTLKSKMGLPQVPVSQKTTTGNSRACRQPPAASSDSIKRTENLPFSRSDGGRFSMRGTQPTKGQTKPMAKSNAAQQQSPEMAAWLRRKEYDPRKAAAAADYSQKEKQQKQQDAFMACRSFSNSTNAKSPFFRWRQSRKAQLAMGTQRNNLSHDDLSRLGESMDDESLPGMAGDSCSNSLQRTVDELTQKCHKSIELLKLCNQSGLSSSVEQLLEKVAEGSQGEVEVHCGIDGSGGRTNTDNENIFDRLERLSSAFDAIQKYLEEQTSMSSSRASLAALAGFEILQKRKLMNFSVKIATPTDDMATCKK